LAALWYKAGALGSGFFRISLPASTKAAMLYWPFLNLLYLLNIAVLFFCGRLPQQTNLRLASVSHLFRSSNHFLVSLDLNYLFSRRLFIGRPKLKTLETLPA
jgi:hypothetical protein